LHDIYDYHISIAGRDTHDSFQFAYCTAALQNVYLWMIASLFIF